jgi:hypothetical protein
VKVKREERQEREGLFSGRWLKSTFLLGPHWARGGLAIPSGAGEAGDKSAFAFMAFGYLSFVQAGPSWTCVGLAGDALEPSVLEGSNASVETCGQNVRAPVRGFLEGG